jgi:hypothetical protein
MDGHVASLLAMTSMDSFALPPNGSAVVPALAMTIVKLAHTGRRSRCFVSTLRIELGVMSGFAQFGNAPTVA